MCYLYVHECFPKKELHAVAGMIDDGVLALATASYIRTIPLLGLRERQRYTGNSTIVNYYRAKNNNIIMAVVCIVVGGDYP